MDGFKLVGGAEEGPRAGTLELPSGKKVRTPLFMPVATKLSVKTLGPEELDATGTEAVITNGFLSSLEPGSEVLKHMGGMHAFMNWDGVIFSDSGGFQFIRKGFEPRISDEGVELRSPFSGDRVFLTPGTVVDFHIKHGVDVGMVLDHCPPFPSTREDLVESAERTVFWARRSMERIRMEDVKELSPYDDGRLPLLFGITQGGTDRQIRRDCTERLVDLEMSGYGIGGLSIGEDKEITFRALTDSTELLPVDKPRYFMGVGDPEDLIRSVRSGVDIFDSVFPTRNARHKNVFTAGGRENIRAGKWKGMESPIMECCRCPVCSSYSRGYIYHLFKANEPLGPRLTSIHNIFYMQDLVKRIRKAILKDEMSEDPSLGDLMDFH